jgi:hypothetical protein
MNDDGDSCHGFIVDETLRADNPTWVVKCYTSSVAQNKVWAPFSKRRAGGRLERVRDEVFQSSYRSLRRQLKDVEMGCRLFQRGLCSPGIAEPYLFLYKPWWGGGM